MSKAMLLATTLDSDGNPWSMRIWPDESAILSYLLEQIAKLDANEGKRLLDQPSSGAKRWELQ